VDLTAHIEGTGSIRDIRAYLDNLEPSARWQQLAALGKKQQRTLFLKAEASDPLTQDDLVDTVQVPLVHRGKNSLMFFRDFEKRMVLTPDGTIWGYNEGSTRTFLGPGYFRARPCSGPVETQRSSWVVDYFDVPPTKPVDAWPTVHGNGRLLSFFVYNQTRDYLRKVSTGVTIGSAYKHLFGKERKLDSYFLLMRHP
jgi:hypothetical protein